MSYPPSLSYFLDKLSGYSTNYFRLEAQNSTTASANQIVRFTLPSNALLNLYTGATSKFCVKQWEGFLGTAEPKIMDSSLVPDLVVSIYLADDSVLANVKGTALPGTATTGIDIDGAGSVSYSLANIHATIECIGLADGTYDNMVSSMIQTKGFLEVPFKQYYSFQDTHSGQMRFSVATQSLDRIWAVSRNGSTSLSPLAQT